MRNSEQISLDVNGEARVIPTGTTVEELLEILELDPDTVVVELNETILAAEKRAETILANGDSLELIQFVGGG